MKVCMFHLMPYRDLPEDFDRHYKSAFIDPLWFDVADSEKVGQYYNATLDELLLAAKVGMHGVCTNQHHQNVYGFMANPSLMGSVLARETNGQDVAIIQLGSTLPSTTPPTRIAEEYAMLDCISGGRLVAGFPTGLPTDATISNGVVPVEQRERFREALALVTKAWSAKEIFAWNGRHYQLGMVNLWPRPIQQPHPPIWIPGAGSAETIDFVAQRRYCYMGIPYFHIDVFRRVFDQFRESCQKAGYTASPSQMGWGVPVYVAETDRQAREEFEPHFRYFIDKLLRGILLSPPGYTSPKSAITMLKSRKYFLAEQKSWDDIEKGVFAIVGSPETVRQKLEHYQNELGVGVVLTGCQTGAVDHHLARRSMELLAREVLPKIRGAERETASRV
jgi:alkanesulfonate monooxygenase SsuD/methylene tetrahydromethanopterin reductase-like flavin-dependent oxidoreductase (luciferase family)